MEKQIQTVRESIDAYRARIASKGFSGTTLDHFFYPQDNHIVALKASSDIIKKVFEESGEFAYNKRNEKMIAAHLQSFDCLKTDALILTQCLDKGGEDRGGFCEEYNLDPTSWIPMTIHPYHSSRITGMDAEEYFPFKEGLGKNSEFLGAIETLEVLLSVAEKYNIPMVTAHKDGRLSNPLVRYLAALNRGEE